MNSITVMTDNALKNGRVDLLSALPTFNVSSYNKRTTNNEGYAREITSGVITVNEVSKLFFSSLNIDALQDAVRYRIYVETNGQFTIGRQSDQELKVVMRSIYIQHGKNNAGDCVGQVRELNAKVLEWVVPEVLSNVLQYARYKHDASTLPMPMDRAPMMSTKGTKVLEIKSFM